MKEVYIVAAKRTALGSFGGTLSSVPAPTLGARAIEAALASISLSPNLIEETFMGNVLSANLGQAPARQAAIMAGIPDTVPATTINKVCASGMKAIMLGTQSILLGDRDIVLAGGLENMSAVPYYLDGARTGYKLGNNQVIDGLVKDGLTDVYNAYHMGNAAELCAKECNISREAQDDYATLSYQRAADAWGKGFFKDEIAPVIIPQRKGDDIVFAEDEEYKKVVFDKIPALRPVFQKEGTVTAANASTLNDGAAAVILMSKEKMEALGLKPLARIISYADAAQQPEWFTTAPAKAIPLALKKAGLSIADIDYFEINEAFSVVSLANIDALSISKENTNIFGGAVSIGHPLGCSGTRIVVTLTSVLKHKNARYGVAGICNGGGGASAMVIENLL